MGCSKTMRDCSLGFVGGSFIKHLTSPQLGVSVPELFQSYCLGSSHSSLSQVSACFLSFLSLRQSCCLGLSQSFLFQITPHFSLGFLHLQCSRVTGWSPLSALCFKYPYTSWVLCTCTVPELLPGFGCPFQGLLARVLSISNNPSPYTHLGFSVPALFQSWFSHFHFRSPHISSSGFCIHTVPEVLDGGHLIPFYLKYLHTSRVSFICSVPELLPVFASVLSVSNNPTFFLGISVPALSQSYCLGLAHSQGG